MKYKKLIITASGIFLFIFFTYLFNETPFMYHEPDEYKKEGKVRIFSQEAMPRFMAHPDSHKVILFIHGYKATPFDFHYLAGHFSRQYNVALLLLPGHGTSEEEFQKTYFSQWYSYAKEQYLRYRKKYRVYLCGLSMGGTISLRLAEEFYDKKDLAPSGVICIASPVFLNCFNRGVLFDWRLYLIRYIS
ncbi:MAG: alpha/beta fold hydrolase, partial [Spirochaetes bacterium]|nr:alpha/beta fold hydrolase [Spirochaetota bacterium]